jgi:hypothetical protein
MIVAELCRHPLIQAQVLRIEEYARAFGINDEGQRLARDLIAAGNAVADADYHRMINNRLSELEEPAHGFERGSATGSDFTVVDHLSMADLPLEEVRERFGVPPRER